MPDNAGRGYVRDNTPEELERQSRMKKGTPGATFDCPNAAQALKLARAFRLWGAHKVTHAGRVVTVEATGPWITTLAGLFGDGTMERVQCSDLPASSLAHLFFEPGESRG